MRFGHSVFRGTMPRIDPRDLPDGAAAAAIDCDLHNGALQAFRDLQFVVTPTKPGVKKTIYRFGLDGSNEAQYWWTFTDDVDIAKGQISSDSSERTFFTGDSTLGWPAVTDASLALLSGTNYPVAAYRLGPPAPASAPNAVVSGTGDGNSVTRAYAYTYVTAFSHEGQPSPAVEVTVQGGQTVTLNAFSAAPAGYGITSRRIYRIESGASGVTENLFVAEIVVATTSYADSTPTVDLPGGTLESQNYVPPPASMRGLVNMPNGMQAAFDGYDVMFCVPFIHHAWPYREPVAFPVVGLGVYADLLVVATKGRPYVMFSTDPESITSRQLELDEPCASKRSIARNRLGVMYASPNGLVLVSPSGAKLVTDEIIDKLYWQSLNPASIVGVGYDGRYIGFYDNGSTTGGFVFDPTNELSPFTLLDIYATAAYNDPARDEMYLSIGADIRQFEGVAQRRSYTHTSRIFNAGWQRNVGFGKVRANAYPVTMQVYADGALVHTETVANDRVFRLPSQVTANEWQFTLTGTNRVTAAYIATDPRNLRDV